MADQILLETLASGLVNQLALVKELEEELKGFEDQYSKDFKETTKRIDDINVQIDRTIKDAIKAIPTPKDGKDGIDAEVDYNSIEDFISKLVSELPKAKDGSNGVDGQDGNDGRNGLDGAKGQDGNDGLDGQDGERGLTGASGAKGEAGEDGLTIEEIFEKNGYIVIILSDGTKKELKLPAIEKHMTTVRAGNNGTDLIIKTAVDMDLNPQSQTILVDATAGDIIIKLPEPSISINSDRSYRIKVSKIDNTTNIVTIVSFNGEIVLYDSFFELFRQGEAMEFVTDGINWY